MALQPQQLTVDGIKFQFLPLPLRQTLKLDKRVVGLLKHLDLNALMALSDKKPEELTQGESNWEAKHIIENLANVIDSLNDADLDYILDTVAPFITVIRDGFPPQSLEDEANRNALFAGKVNTFYKVLFTYCQYIKLSLFAVVTIG